MKGQKHPSTLSVLEEGVVYREEVESEGTARHWDEEKTGGAGANTQF